MVSKEKDVYPKLDDSIVRNECPLPAKIDRKKVKKTE